MTQPKIGDKFVGSNHKIFTVTDIKTMNKDLWVEYTDEKESRDYLATLESFLSRFTPIAKD